MKHPTHALTAGLRSRLAPLFLLLLLAAGPLAAQQMNYQGRLTDASGNSVPDAQYTLRFNLYDATTGGTQKWGTQTNNMVDVVQGRFNVVLGPTALTGGSLVNAFTGGNRYLEIIVGNNAPITPRQQILFAPEALHALQADAAASLGRGGVPLVSIVNNNVGIGTATPDGKLTVRADGGLYPQQIHIRGTSNPNRLMAVGYNTTDNYGYIQATEQGVSTTPLILNRDGGFVGIGTNAPSSPLHVLGSIRANGLAVVNGGISVVNGGLTVSVGTISVVNGGLSVVGGDISVPVNRVLATAFVTVSDRNRKENFAPVNPGEVLDKVAALPISRWNFKGDTATPHVGPMAQDFHAAFGLGTDDRYIATVDADGVALAAIQGLNSKVEERSRKLEAENAALQESLAELKALVLKLAADRPGQ